MAVPKRVVERIQSRTKSFQGILEAQKARNVSEADTVTVVKDILKGDEAQAATKRIARSTEKSIRKASRRDAASAQTNELNAPETTIANPQLAK